MNNTLHDHYFNKIKNSKETASTVEEVVNAVNKFRLNFLEEFTELIDYNEIESFNFFIEWIEIFAIYTREDFITYCKEYYDWIGECNFFDYHQLDDDYCYKAKLLNLLKDKEITISQCKEELKRYRSIDTLRLDGVMDNILHCEYAKYLPKRKDFIKHKNIHKYFLDYYEAIEYIKNKKNGKE